MTVPNSEKNPGAVNAARRGKGLLSDGRSAGTDGIAFGRPGGIGASGGP